MKKTKPHLIEALTLLPALFLAVFVPIIGAAPAPAGDVLALVNGTLIDGTGADAVSDAVVVVKGDRIAAVGPRAQVSVPAGAKIVDARGGAILPGLIDAHVHYAQAIREKWASMGATTIRSLGEADWRFGAGWKRLGGGARVVTAGPILTVPNGYPIWLYGDAAALPIASVDEARRWTARLLGPDFGHEVIKVALDGTPQLSVEELRAIVQAAHARGARVSAHVTNSMSLQKALDAGVDDMAHMVMDNLSEALIIRMVSKNVYIVPTLKIMPLTDWNYSNVRRFVAAGGKVAVGTDYNNLRLSEDMFLQEMEAMQAAGMTLMQVLVAATKNGAHVCGLEKELGTLETGKIADILVVRGNPMRNLRDLADVRMVIQNGAIIRE